jgi:ATP-dependent helicase/nuclease subunit A
MELIKQSLADQAARDRICNDLDTSLVVEAAAGTGKTSALISRILAAVSSGRVTLDRMVAVTFTEFAAGELKLRLRGALERGAKDKGSTPQQVALLEKAISELEEARIGTIHSFCSDLLREHPVEAGIDPLFEVAPEDRAGPLFELAFERWFEQQLDQPGDAVKRILRRVPRKEWSGKRSGTLTRRPRDNGPKKMLRAAAWALTAERDFSAPWREPVNFERINEIDSLIDEMEELGSWSDKGDPEQWFTKSLQFLKRFVSDITRLEALGQSRDYDGIEARLFGMLPTWKAKNYRAYFVHDEFPKEDLLERRDALKERIQKFVNSAGAELAPRLRNELWSIVDEFERLKDRAGYIDFLDLLLRARNLIRDDERVRTELQQRFTHVFVDEFQDTDPLQAEILMLLAADDPSERDWRNSRPVAGKLFIVGDPKQSIYRFRRADVALYQEVKRQVVNSGGALVELNVSFRSAPEIQDAVNGAFAPIMSESSTQAQYVPLLPFKQTVADQPAVIALPVSKPYGDFGKCVDWKIEQSLPEDVAGFIDWLINDSGWTVTERERPETRVPVEPRHVCLLFRRLRHYATDVTRPYVEALEAHRVPHLLVGGSSFHSREEIEAIRNVLTAVEWPDDELAVFATLRGPLFGFTDAQLLSYRTLCKTLHPFKQPPEDLPASLLDVVNVLSILRDLHRKRNRRPVAETIGELLAITRAHAGFANWPTGEQALANIMRLTDMARRAERNGLISFRAFVDWLDEQAETGEAGDAPIMEEGVDGVRIMTVHKAKGLEFPVVILVDLTAKDSREPTKWVDQVKGLSAMRLAGCTPIEVQEHADEETRIEKEEAARVLYVAATRARDLLVVTAVGDAPYDGWLAALNPVIYPTEGTNFNPLATQPTGCPQFGDDNVVDRPRNALRPYTSVKPGLHVPLSGKHRVVWWDPSVLPAGARVEGRSQLTDFLREDQMKLKSEAGVIAHQEWQRQRDAVRNSASVPQWRVVTATSEATTIDDGGKDMPTVSVETISIDFTRPHGKRFGTLVHTIMSAVDLNAQTQAIEDLAKIQGRLFGANDEEIQSAIKIVGSALAHPLLRRAAEASARGDCRREVPIVMPLDNGRILEGIVDLAFREDENASLWTVVDYKTDFEIKGRLDEYRRQVGLYVQAIARATKQSAHGVLLRL